MTDPRADKVATPKAVCTVCGKSPTRARGMCAAHYSQARRAQKGTERAASQLRAPAAGKNEGTPKGHTRNPKRAKVARTLGGLLTLTSTLARPVTPEWLPLTEREVDLLTKTGTPLVLDSPTLLRWVERLDGAGGPKLQFGAAVLVCAIPRAVMAKLVTPEQAQPVFNIALAIALADPDEELPEPPSEEGEPDRGAAPQPAHRVEADEPVAVV